jgi:integrase
MTRRGQGEGTIRQRREDLFEGRLRNGAERRSVYGRTRAEARTKLRDLARQVEAGLSLAGGRQTVATYLDKWLDSVAQHRVRSTTFARYGQLVRMHVTPAIGALPLSKLTGQHLAELYSNRLAAGQSARSVEQLHGVLHSALRQAVRWDLIARNPADQVSPPRPKRPEIHALTGDQVRAMLEAATGDPLEALYVLAVTTGMRQGEMLGLTWSAVDLAGGRLEVRASLVRRRAATWSLEDPKSAKSRRRIRLSAAAVAALRAHRVRQAEARLLVGSDWQDNDLVFPDAWGRPLDGAHVTGRDLRLLLERAGLPRIRFHDLRHTAATLLLASGTHPKMVQELLGHSTIALTLDVYSHVTPSMHDEAAATMDRLLAGS